MNHRTDKVTVPDLKRFKVEASLITMLTAYDASFARLVDQAGCDCVLVGDSLGNVIQGHDSTLRVSVDDIAYHVEAVGRGLSRALLIADMPFLSYHDRTTTMAAAGTLMRAGAEMVKLEGAGPVIDRVAELVEHGIPVCAHLGLTPQHVHQLGGYRVQARDQRVAEALLADAERLQQAGAGLLVVECVPESVGAMLSSALEIPVIGIGAGAEVDGQVLVLYDVLGISIPPRPRFVADFLCGCDSVQEALSAYVDAVRERKFPGREHVYS